MLLTHAILPTKVCLSLTDRTSRDKALHNANLSAELQTLSGKLLPLWQEFLKSNLQLRDQISLHQAIKSNSDV